MIDYTSKRTIAKEEVKKTKEDHWEEFEKRLQESYQGNQNLFWGAMKRVRKTKVCPIRRMKNDNREIMKEENEILETWTQYSHESYNSPRANETRKVGQLSGLTNSQVRQVRTKTSQWKKPIDTYEKSNWEMPEEQIKYIEK